MVKKQLNKIESLTRGASSRGFTKQTMIPTLPYTWLIPCDNFFQFKKHLLEVLHVPRIVPGIRHKDEKWILKDFKTYYRTQSCDAVYKA